MFLSKIWFVLVGLGAGAAATAAFVAPRAADREIVNLQGERLDRAQYAAEQMLKADAHSWIDYVAKLSRDANLADSLDAASRGAGEARVVSDTARARLKALVPNLGGIGLESVGAVDARGRLIARLGEREGESGESLAGIEVISDALRGYLSDDVWGAGGKLQRVAAVPVLSRARDRIVGALWVGAETGKRLAEVWKQNLGLDIAILLRGKVATSTVPEALISGLPAKIEERKQEITDSRRTRPISFNVGSDRLLAVAAPFIGQAGEQGGLFALIGKVSPASSPFALMDTTTAEDLSWGNFPWLGLAFSLVVILGVGLALQRLETERPLQRLRDEVQRLARGELQKLDDTVHPGKFGGIARDVNAAMERFTLASPHRTDTARKDLGAILGPAPTAPPSRTAGVSASVFDLPQSHFDTLAPPSAAFGGMSRPATPSPMFLTPPAPEAAAPLGELPPSREVSPPRGYGGPPTLTGAANLGAMPERRLSSPPMQPPPPAPPGPAPSRPPLPPLPPSFGPSLTAASSEDNVPTGIVANPFAAGSPAYGEQVTAVGAAALEARNAMTAIASPAAPLSEEDAGEEEPSSPGSNGNDEPLDDRAYTAHIREVFEAYVATRRRCGETVATLTLDKFQARLDTNRQQLVAKYGCRSARFSVYVKDGKAAVKATPLR